MRLELTNPGDPRTLEVVFPSNPKMPAGPDNVTKTVVFVLPNRTETEASLIQAKVNKNLDDLRSNAITPSEFNTRQCELYFENFDRELFAGKPEGWTKRVNEALLEMVGQRSDEAKKPVASPSTSS